MIARGAYQQQQAALIEAFEEAIAEVWGKRRGGTPSKAEWIEAAALVAEGVTPEIVKMIAVTQITRMKERSGQQMRFLTAIGRDVRTAMAEREQRDAAASSDPVRDRFAAEIQIFQRDPKQWWPQFGPAPGEPGCRLPKHIQDELLAGAGTGAA